MAKPCSKDLRQRVVAAVDGGLSRRRQAAGLFDVRNSTVVRWVQRFRATGSVAARPMGGDDRSRLTGERAWNSATRRGGAGSDRGRAARGTERSRGYGRPWDGVPVFRARGHHVQKKACTQPSKSGLTWLRHAGCGRMIRRGLIRQGSSLSMRAEHRPRWRVFTDGPSAVAAWSVAGVIGRR